MQIKVSRMNYSYSNTSYVAINPRYCIRVPATFKYSNTSYVAINPDKKPTKKPIKKHSNTSYVAINPVQFTLNILVVALFKYIVCCY